MELYLALIAKHGEKFALDMIKKIREEANGVVPSRSRYSYSEEERAVLIERAMIWRESIILYNHMLSIGVDFKKPPYGFRELR